MEERLQKILSRAGFGSRRSCEELITAGRVKVNGQIATLGMKADARSDKISVNEQPIERGEELVYIAVNKPRNVISAVSPQDNRRTVRDLVDLPGHLYPVGRLDVDSEGLILLTNDGELTNRLTHPSFNHEKEYRVLVASRPDEKQLAAWRNGVVLEDGYRTRQAEVRMTGSHGKGAWMKVVLKEGKKRQIREMGRLTGLPVVRIIRIRIGTLQLGSLKTGQWRHLGHDELSELLESTQPGNRPKSGSQKHQKPTVWKGSIRKSSTSSKPAALKRSPRKPVPTNKPLPKTSSAKQAPSNTASSPSTSPSSKPKTSSQRSSSPSPSKAKSSTSRSSKPSPSTRRLRRRRLRRLNLNNLWRSPSPMAVSQQNNVTKPISSWLDRPFLPNLNIKTETIIFAVILVIALVSRFYDLESRVMSHDENTHVYFSWKLYRGDGFSHDPLMHGPLQFLMVAMSYFMFGDNDFTARIPAAIFSILTVAFMWNFRRYLGKAGAVVAAVLMLISPYMLYYGRYVRNEAYVALFGVIMIWAIWRYLETAEAKYTYWLTAVTILHFTSKETAFIYTAQALIFLAFYQIYLISKKSWKKPGRLPFFVVAFLVGVLLVGISLGFLLVNRPGSGLEGTNTASPAIPGQTLSALTTSTPGALVISMAILGVIAMGLSIYYLIDGYTWKVLKNDLPFGLVILLGTLILPQLSPFIIDFLGWQIPVNASQVQALTTTNIIQMALVVVPMLVLSVIIGLLWNPKIWLVNAGIWYGIFTVVFTTVFTNGAGFFTGLVGSLGYWIAQQAVQRGSQPWYYYWLVQVPIYEYLPALGSILGVILAAFGIGKLSVSSAEDQDPLSVETESKKVPVVAFLIFWVVSSFLAYSVAGEKMPWLTVHITLGMILLAGWAIGTIIDMVDWQVFKQRRAWLTILVLFLFIVSLATTFSSLLGNNPPFAGKELDQLRATSTFFFSTLMLVASGIGLFYLVSPWSGKQFVNLLILSIFGLLALLTIHVSIQAAYINYDNANELLVYAHSARGVKDALAQIEDISLRTTDGLAVIVAYDSETSYPYYWYLRNYSNARFFGKDPSRSLREAAAILVGDANYSKLEPVVADGFLPYEYIRLWWPNQDYYGLTLERIWGAITNPEMRAALFQIWLNRDYENYGQIKGRDMSLPNWSPAVKMRLYIRKDVASQLWDYGVSAVPGLEISDPYEGKYVTKSAYLAIGEPGAGPSQFLRPRGIAIAPDGSFYVADTENHRIQHFTAEGVFINQWGSFGDITTGSAPEGTFNQPWGIAADQDGNVFVADLWNHRIQKFSPEGEFLLMWGKFGQAESPDAFWGPRDVAINSRGEVFITDTGNKRVVIFDNEGKYIDQFGSVGMLPGQFDEPVGLAIDENDQVYVADTWNQRIQVFAAQPGAAYTPILEWEISGWYGQSLDNKPYLDIDTFGKVYVTDPEGQRVLVFNTQGEFLYTWGDFGSGLAEFGIAGAVAVDQKGELWVSDPGNNRIMLFNLQSED